MELLPRGKQLKIYARRILVFWISFTVLSALVYMPGSPFSGDIPEARAAEVYDFIQQGTTSWTVPDDWSDTNTIYVIGAGGGGADGNSSGSGGGGGGAFSTVSNVTTATPTRAVTVSVGLGGTAGANANGVAGGASYFHGASCATSVVCAMGGNGAAKSVTGAAGGNATGGVGTQSAGGAGGNGHSSDGGGGGGGAAGPNGAGKNGGVANSANSGGGGGGGGGSSGGTGSTNGSTGGATGGQGGAGGAGTGGGTGGNAGNGNAGSNGGGGGGSDSGTIGGAGGNGVVTWTDSSNSATAGSGGGGGGGSNADSGAAGGYYGGGGGGGEDAGGAGRNGIIVVRYTQGAIIWGKAYENGNGTILADCDGSTANIAMVVATSTPGNFYTTCDTATGQFRFSTVGSIPADTMITIYINGETATGATVIKYSGTNYVAEANVRKNHLILRNDSTGSITNANLAGFDSDGGTEDTGDTDVNFTSNSNNLALESGQILYISQGDTYDPGGTVTTSGTAGDLVLATSTLAYLDTTGNTIGGSIILSEKGGTGGILYIDANTTVDGNIMASSTANVLYSGGATPTLTMNGAAVSITARASPTSTFYNLSTPEGFANTLTLASTTIVANNLRAGAGTTITGSSNITVTSALGSGTVTHTGTFTVDGTGDFANESAWSFSNLTFGDGSGAATTTTQGSGGVTVSGTLTVANNQGLNAGGKTWTLSGSGTPFTMSGNWNSSSSTVAYTSGSGVSALSSRAMTNGYGYNNLTINSSGDTFTAGVAVTASSTLTVTAGSLVMGSNNLTVGSTESADTGSIKVASGQTLNQSSGGTTTVLSASGSNCIGSNGTSCAGQPGTLVFGSLTIGGSSKTFTTTLTGDQSPTTTIDGTFTIAASATFDAGTASSTIRLTGLGTPFVNSGTFTYGSSTILYAGAGEQTVASLGGSSGSNGYYNLFVKPTAATTIKLGSTANQPLTVNSNFVVGDGSTATRVSATSSYPDLLINADMTIAASGTFFAPTSTFTITGDFTNSGTYTHDSGTVRFSPTSTSYIIGATTFYDFTSTSSGKIIMFQTSGAPVFTFAGTLTITGTDGNPVFIKSDSAGIQWQATFSTSQAGVSYAVLNDPGCESGSAIVTLPTSVSFDNNDSCWGGVTRGGGPAGGSPGGTDGSSGGGTTQTGGGTEGGGGGTEGGSGGGPTQTGGGTGGGGGASP